MFSDDFFKTNTADFPQIHLREEEDSSVVKITHQADTEQEFDSEHMPEQVSEQAIEKAITSLLNEIDNFVDSDKKRIGKVEKTVKWFSLKESIYKMYTKLMNGELNNEQAFKVLDKLQEASYKTFAQTLPLNVSQSFHYISVKPSVIH